MIGTMLGRLRCAIRNCHAARVIRGETLAQVEVRAERARTIKEVKRAEDRYLERTGQFDFAKDWLSTVLDDDEAAKVLNEAVGSALGGPANAGTRRPKD